MQDEPVWVQPNSAAASSSGPLVVLTGALILFGLGPSLSPLLPLLPLVCRVMWCFWGCRPELHLLVKMDLNDLTFASSGLLTPYLVRALTWGPGPLCTGAAKRRWPSLGVTFWKRSSEFGGPWKRARPPGRKSSCSFGGDKGELAGGATWFLLPTEDAEMLRRRGRWLSSRVMEIYLQEVTSLQFFPVQSARTKHCMYTAMQFPRAE